METGGSKGKKETLMVTSLCRGLQAHQEVLAWLARKGRLSSGPRDPRGLPACLGLLALEDLDPLGHQDPQGHQDHQRSLEQLWPFQAHPALQDTKASQDVMEKMARKDQ